MSIILCLNKEEVVSKFIIRESISKQINEMYFEFKGINEENIEALTKFLKADNVLVLPLIDWVAIKEPLTGASYLKNIDIIQG